MTEIRATIVVAAKDEASANLKKVGDTSNKLTGDLKRGFGDAVQNLTGFNVATLGVVGAVGALGLGLKYAINSAMEAEKVMAQTEAVIKSTGGAAGLTAKQISDMAGALSTLNAVDDETIQSGANLLLTFKAVKSEAFEPALQAALDMSIAMGIDLKQSVIQVGKALEDPIRGLTALRRSGVSFTAEQQNTIKALVETGQAAEAQTLILEELNKQFGGSGAAMAETYAGKVTNLKTAFGNLAETGGNMLLPILGGVTEHLTDQFSAVGAVHQAFADGEIGLAEWAALMAELNATGGFSADYVLEKLNDKIYDNHRATDAATARWQGLANQLTQESVPAMEDQASATEMAGGYMVDYGDAAEGVADILERVERKQKALNMAIQAGLAGDISSATEDYQSVMADTTKEIDRLNTEIDKYSALQGRTITVTEEATVSNAEYRLAAIKAAEAQQELAEYSGDSEKELLQLTVAAEHAQENVNRLGNGLGISTTYTLDFTTKLAELNGALDDQTAKQVEAEAQLKRTTAEFIFQQLSADLDNATLLELGRSLGLIDEPSYAAATAAQELKKKFDEGKISSQEFAADAKILADAIATLQSKDVTINVYTIRTEVFRQKYEAAQIAATEEAGGYGGPGGVGYGGGQAMGGDYVVTKPTLFVAGEAGPERAQFTPLGSERNGGGGGAGIVFEAGAIVVNANGGSAAEISRNIAVALRNSLQGGAYLMGT